MSSDSGIDTLKRVVDLLYGGSMNAERWRNLASAVSAIEGRAMRGQRDRTPGMFYNVYAGYAGYRLPEEVIVAMGVMLSRVGGLSLSNMVASKSKLEPGTLVLGEPVRCNAPGCSVVFVPVVKNQRYHCPKCKSEARKQKRKEMV